MNVNKVKWFHRIAKWFHLGLEYSCRFIKDSERDIVGTLEWQTSDPDEAVALWQKSAQYNGAKRGHFVFQAHFRIDAFRSEGTQKQPAGDRRQIKLDLPEAVPGETHAGPHEPSGEEAEAHEAIRADRGGAKREHDLGESTSRPHESVVRGSKDQSKQRSQGHDREQAKPSLKDIGVFDKKY